ncbi:MAG TPA: hypothetical protein VMB82_11680, partial [Acidimicrobiales bacterium]|nr:hypothetical protein [Acidimicrobiales bacterium]
LESTAVDCWGWGGRGALGNGANESSDVPVAVSGVGGTGTLSGVATVVNDNSDTYCALLTSGAVDCWGSGTFGELGNGVNFQFSTVPVEVLGIGGIGTLSNVTSITTNGLSFCVVLSSGGADCWGLNNFGEVGAGIAPTGSTPTMNIDTPLPVTGIGGSGTLADVSNIVGFSNQSYCAALSTGAVACWGLDFSGDLGDSAGTSSDVPVGVTGLGGIGALTGVTGVYSDGYDTYCATLASTAMDCWGNWIGNGTIQSNSPVAVSSITS